MKKLIFFLLGSGVLRAADPPSPVAAMQASLEKQRAAAQKQRDSIAPQLPEFSSFGAQFFTLAWSSPPILTARSGDPDCAPMPKDDVEAMLKAAAEKEGLKIDLLRAVVNQESGLRPCAVSAKGAMGLMQLMPATAEQLGVRDPFDPKENIAAGAKYLKQLLARYSGDLPLALGAYNSGPARVDAAGTVPAIPETVEYVQRILSALPH